MGHLTAGSKQNIRSDWLRSSPGAFQRSRPPCRGQAWIAPRLLNSARRLGLSDLGHGDAIELVADQTARALTHDQTPIVSGAEVGAEAKAMLREIVAQLLRVETEGPAFARGVEEREQGLDARRVETAVAWT